MNEAKLSRSSSSWADVGVGTNERPKLRTSISAGDRIREELRLWKPSFSMPNDAGRMTLGSCAFTARRGRLVADGFLFLDLWRRLRKDLMPKFFYFKRVDRRRKDSREARKIERVLRITIRKLNAT